MVACRTGGLAGPARCTSARAKREARGQKNPPVVTPLFMLFRPLEKEEPVTKRFRFIGGKKMSNLQWVPRNPRLCFSMSAAMSLRTPTKVYMLLGTARLPELFSNKVKTEKHNVTKIRTRVITLTSMFDNH